MLKSSRNLMLAASPFALAVALAGAANAQGAGQADRLDALIKEQTSRLEELRREVKELKKKQAKTEATVLQTETAVQNAEKSSAAIAKPKTPGATGSPQAGNYVEAGSKRLSWKLPGSDVSLRIGGYAKADFIGAWGGRTNGSPDLFNPVAIATRGVATPTAPGDPNTRFHARQSRLFFEASKTNTPWGPARVLVEADFFGGADLGNEIASNSNTFRLRHAIAEVGPLLGGQFWSTFSDPSTYPEVFDFQGPGGQTFLRVPQLRYTHNFGGGLTGALAVENPEGRVRIGNGPVNGTGVAGALGPGLLNSNVATAPRDTLPDIILRARYESPELILQAAGVAARSATPLGTTPGAINGIVAESDGIWGFGFLATGQIGLPFLGHKKDNLRFQAGYLDGASRYLQDVGGQASFAFSNNLATVESITAYGGYGALQHWWTDSLRSNFVYSRVAINQPTFSSGTQLRDTQYISGNLIYSPFPEVDLGVEYQNGERTDLDGNKGNQSRVQSTIIYRF